MIEVKLTYEEVQALHHLGVENATIAMTEYNRAEHFLRTELDDLARLIRVCDKSGKDGNIAKLFPLGTETSRKLCQNENSRTYFWTHHETSLEYCCFILDRFDFLDKFKDDKEVYDKFFPLYMEDMEEYMNHILIDLNAWFE